MNNSFRKLIRQLFAALYMVLLPACDFQGKKEDISPNQLRIITYNVWYGFTKVPDRKESWIRWMERQQADIVSLQELNGYTPQQLSNDAKAYGHPYCALLKEGGFPTGITSRYPISEITRTTKGFHHGLLRAKILDIYFYVVHLHPGNHEIRNAEVDLILDDVAKLPPDSEVILAGDFNALAGTDSLHYSSGNLLTFFNELDSRYNDKNLNQGKLDYSVIDKVVAAGFVDIEAKLKDSTRVFSGSFPTKIEKEGEHGDQRRLDYIFANKLVVRHMKSASTIATDTTWLLSDHLPVMSELTLVEESDID
jgi:exodeoxyribonuclease-3